ncbi:unnamed protein product [Urochloa humidicola]
MQVELRGLVAQISSSSRKAQAFLALANFDAKANKASGYMDIGQKMLRDAHQKVIHTLRQILHDELHGNNSEDHHEQSHGSDAAPPGDIDMSEHHSTQNIASEHVFDVPILQPEPTEFDMISGGHTNQGHSVGMSVEVQQNTNQIQVLPTDNDGLHTGMEGQLLPICTQVYTDATIDRAIPPAAGISHPQAATTDMTTSGANVVPQIDMQVTDEDNGLQENAGHHMGMERELSPICTQVYTDVTTERTVPPQDGTTDMTTSKPNDNTNDALGPILFRGCTQDKTTHCPIIVPRPQRLTKRPAMYVSPFKGDPQRARAPMTKACAVRKKFHAGMKWKSDIFIKSGLREISGEQILDTFIDAEMLSTQFMSFFVACISHDERHMADGGGYRVFLSQELGEYVNIEEDPDISQWESPAALAVLQRDIGDLDPTKVKLFLLPVMEEEHYSVYCINFIHDRIDVLDSSAEHHTIYHQVLGDRIIRRLNLLFQLATNDKLKEFTRFKRPIIDACHVSHDNDSGLYALKFMELWNGDSFHVPILKENIRHYKSQLLFYGLYHTLNEIKKLPAGLEACRPRM